LHEAPRAAPTGPDRTPEAVCTAVIEAMLPDRPSDDIASLVARTRRLAPSDFAEWDPGRPEGAGAPPCAGHPYAVPSVGLERRFPDTW
jgi:hypothetical protein